MGAVECHSDCFFNTPDGLIALCPPSARHGDLIVVLQGGRVPSILRQQGGPRTASKDTIRFELIGECYLLGYMEGRAIREQQANNLPAEASELV